MRVYRVGRRGKLPFAYCRLAHRSKFPPAGKQQGGVQILLQPCGPGLPELPGPSGPGPQPVGNREVLPGSPNRELGLDDYEGRFWTGLHRHVALVMMAHSFLSIRRNYGLPPQTDSTDGPSCSIP